MSLHPTVHKSINDPREYKVITLPNDLQCLLIHDAEADKSAASLSVKVGFHQDPVDRPGLAHFLEHMLFLGTEKYPKEDEYANFISENSGTRNAFTSAYETNYFFDCANQAFNGALDRFSKFFICPLFTESCSGREINAVNSEHEKNILQDIWRQNQLFRSTSKDNHIFNRFGTGSKQTLENPTIRSDLLEFHQQYYSANLMKAVLYGKETLETLEEWARDFFGLIRNTSKSVPKVTEIPFDSENLGSFWRVLPIQDKDTLDFTWIMEDFEPHYKNNPAKYISHLLGHEGTNSLLSYLMDEGLATGVSSSYNPEREIFTVFSVEVDLTKKGLANYEKVCSIVFGYINMMKKKGAEKWIFEELNKILKFQFDYKDKEKPMGYVYSLATKMHFYPIQDVLRANYLMESFEPELISKAINSLRLDNVRIHLISKSVEKDCNLTEKWYGQKYSVEKLSPELKKLLEDPQVGPSSKSGKVLDYPLPNEFIPQNFDLFAKDFASLPQYPEKIYESEIMESYFKQDNIFKKPKASVIMKAFCNDLGFGYNPRIFSIWSFWLKLFEESLREINYQAQVARLHVAVDFDSGSLNGLKFHIVGFNDSIDKICIDLFKKFRDFDPSLLKDEFENFKQKAKEQQQNFGTSPPYRQAIDITTIFLHNGSGTLTLPEVSLDILEQITFKDVLNFHAAFFKTMRFEGLFIGNLTKEKAIETTKHIEEILSKMREKSRVLHKEAIPEVRNFQLEAGSTFFYERILPSIEGQDKESNSSIINYYQYDQLTHEKKLLMLVLCNYIKSPCFNVLRTEEQLGYIVHNAYYAFRDVLALIILIQSNVKSSHFLSQRIAAFLEKTKEKVEAITDEEFTKHVESIKASMQEKDLSIVQEGERYWAEIVTHKYLWNRREIQIKLLDTLKKEQLIELYNTIFFTQRKLLEVHITSQNHIEENEKIRAERVQNEKNFIAVYSPEELRRRLPLYPDFFSPLFDASIQGKTE